MRQVINRAGIRENLDITKIREKLLRACDNLEVNMVELESHIESIYAENITTKKIQESLINQAVSMTSFEESDWTYVAGRLLMMETEREVFHKRGFSYGELYKSTVFSQEHNVSVSGGSEKMTYYGSFNYLDQGGLLKIGEDGMKRYNATGKFTSELTDWLKFNFTALLVMMFGARVNSMILFIVCSVVRTGPIFLCMIQVVISSVIMLWNWNRVGNVMYRRTAIIIRRLLFLNL